MIRRPPRSTLFPTRRSSDLSLELTGVPSCHLAPVRRKKTRLRSLSCHDHLSASSPTIADRKSTRLNSSHSQISYAVFCLKKKKKHMPPMYTFYTSMNH